MLDKVVASLTWICMLSRFQRYPQKRAGRKNEKLSNSRNLVDIYLFSAMLNCIMHRGYKGVMI